MRSRTPASTLRDVSGQYATIRGPSPHRALAGLSFATRCTRALHRLRPTVPVAPRSKAARDLGRRFWVGDGFYGRLREQAYLDHGSSGSRAVPPRERRGLPHPRRDGVRFTIDVEGVQVSGVNRSHGPDPRRGYEIIDYKTTAGSRPARRSSVTCSCPSTTRAERSGGSTRAPHPVLPPARTADVHDANERRSRRAPTPDRDVPNGSRRAGSSRGRTRCATGASFQLSARCSATCTSGSTVTRRRG